MYFVWIHVCMFVFQYDKNLKCKGYCLWLQTKLVAALVTWKYYKQNCLIFVQNNVTFLQTCLDDSLCNTTTTLQLINSPFLLAGDYFVQVSEPVFSDQQLLISCVTISWNDHYCFAGVTLSVKIQGAQSERPKFSGQALYCEEYELRNSTIGLKAHRPSGSVGSCGR